MPPTNKFDESKLGMSIVEIHNKIDRLTEMSADTKENVNKIKEAVYNPEVGLYARLRLVESWKAVANKIIWILFAAVLSIGVKFVYSATETKATAKGKDSVSRHHLKSSNDVSSSTTSNP